MLTPKGELTAEISIIRNYNTSGSVTRVYPTVNGKKIAGLYTEDYVRFYVEKGVYIFGLMVPAHGRWIDKNKVKKNVQVKKRYYFLISPSFLNGFEIEEIDEAEGEKRILTSDLIQTGKISSNPDPFSKALIPVFRIMGGVDADTDQ